MKRKVRKKNKLPPHVKRLINKIVKEVSEEILEEQRARDEQIKKIVDNVWNGQYKTLDVLTGKITGGGYNG